jgi:Flp pilus assembly protein TadB
VVGLVIAVCAGAMLVLYAIDRGVKARIRARRRHVMSDRLAAATVRAEEQQARRQATAKASKELTSVMPAIKRPPLSTPGKQGRPASADRPGQPGRGSTRPGQRSTKTGPQQAWRR